MKKNKKIILILGILLALFLIISLVAIIHKNFSNTPRDDIFETVIIDDFEEKVNNLYFVDQDSVESSFEANKYEAKISDDKVIVSLLIDGNEASEFSYDEFGKPTSITLDFTTDKVYLFVLAEDGRVYSIEYSIELLTRDPGYRGDITSFNVTNAVSISVLNNFDINNEPIDIPYVYILTIEDRYLTNEKLIENQNGLVELVGEE